MTGYREVEEELMRIGWDEEIYRGFYQECPEAYKTPIISWEEFREFSPDLIPEEPPTEVGAFLTEQEFFPHSGIEVNCFRNSRYCPAFRHQLEFIKIVYVLAGQARLYLNQECYQLSAGQFCMVSPGMEQAVLACHDEDVVINILLRASTFAEAFSSLLMEQNIISGFFWKMSFTKYSNQILYFACGNNELLKRTVLKIYRELYKEESPSNLILKNYVMIFLGEALRRHKDEIRFLEKQEESDDKIPTILQDMKRHLDQVTLGWLAGKWKMSEAEMNSYLRLETGYSYAYLVNDMRIRQAANILLRTELSVERIMEETGFYDLSFFYRQFKKRYGMTPQNYRIYGGKGGNK